VKSNALFFLGVLAALVVSWAGIVLGSNAQLGALPPYYDDNDQATYPQWMAGNAARGQLVYKDLGCVACHTQQVRRPGFGSDQARGWGDRQSVARDYIYQPFPQIGASRVGPDLANLADRSAPEGQGKPAAFDADDFLNLLYSGKSGMPSYRFLFEKRRIGAEAQPSQEALKLTGSLKPADGWEIVPTARAKALVAYLLNLKNTYAYPEATPVAPAKPEGTEAPASPGVPPAPSPASAMPEAVATPQAPAPAATIAPSTAPATAMPANEPQPAASAAPAAAKPAPEAPSAPSSTPTPSPTAAAAAPNTGAAAPAAAPAQAPTTAPTEAKTPAAPAPAATAPAAAPAATTAPTPSPTAAAPATTEAAK
jgi:cytochrome c oxidase cbb3-type subunit 2